MADDDKVMLVTCLGLIRDRLGENEDTHIGRQFAQCAQQPRPSARHGMVVNEDGIRPGTVTEASDQGFDGILWRDGYLQRLQMAVDLAARPRFDTSTACHPAT